MKKLRDYLTYSWWKFALLIVAAWFGWSLYFQMSTPPIPEEQKVILGVYAYGSETAIDAYMEEIRQELMPDMEEMNVMFIMPDATYGDMILTTRIAARECDIYALTRSQFQGYAAQGAYMPLDTVLPDLIADLEAER